MTTLSYFADESVLPRSTLTELFFKAVDEHGSRVAFERMVSDVELSSVAYTEAFSVVKRYLMRWSLKASFGVTGRRSSRRIGLSGPWRIMGVCVPG